MIIANTIIVNIIIVFMIFIFTTIETSEGETVLSVQKTNVPICISAPI